MGKFKWLILLFFAIVFLNGCAKSSITSIEIDQTSVKDSYNIDEFNFGNIYLIVNMSGNKINKIPLDSSMISKSDLTLLKNSGKHTITVNYKGFTTTLVIYINSSLEEKLKLIYQKAVKESLITESYEEWLENIKGKDGVSIVDAKVNLQGHLIITLSNKETIDAGLVYVNETLEMRVLEGYIQWKYKGDSAWSNLLSLSELNNSGSDGLSAYEIYKKYNPDYTKTEIEWIDDLVNGKLATSDKKAMVIFNTNGGYIDGSDSFYVNKGSLLELPIPRKEGYEFSGWFEDLNHVSPLQNYVLVNSNISLYAKWKQIKETNITFRVRSGSINESTIQEIIDEFESRYPDIHVELDYVTGLELRDSTFWSIQENKAPDIVVGYPEDFAHYYSSGYLMNLQEFINDNNNGYSQAELNDFFALFLDENRGFDSNNKGDLHALPFLKLTDVMVYNKTAFQALFGDNWERKIPRTWQEIEAVSEEIITKTKAGELDRTFVDSINPITNEPVYLKVSDYFKNPDVVRFRPFGYDANAVQLINLIQQSGGTFFEKINNEKGYISFDNAESKAAMDYFMNLTERGYFGLPANFNYSYISDAFQNMQVLMCVNTTTSTGYNYMTTKYDYELGIAPVPYFNENSKLAMQNGTNIGILNQNSESERLASWLFVKHLLSTENCAKIAMDTGYMPIRKSVYELDSFKEFLDNPPQNKIYKALSQKIFINEYIEDYKFNSLESIIGYSDILDEVVNLFNNVLVYKEQIEVAFAKAYANLYPFVEREDNDPISHIGPEAQSIIIENTTRLKLDFEIQKNTIRGNLPIQWEIICNDQSASLVEQNGRLIVKVFPKDYFIAKSDKYDIVWGEAILKATVKVGNQTQTRFWHLYIQPNVFYSLTVAEAKNIHTRELISIRGTIIYTINSGFTMMDETGAIFVYSTEHKLKVGDKVKVTGTKDVYFDMPQISRNPAVEVLETEEVNHAELAVDKGIDAIEDTDKSVKEQYGAIYKVTGIIVKNGSLSRYGLKDSLTGTVLTIYDYSQGLEELSEKEASGQSVEMIVVVQDYHSNGYWRVMYVPGTIKDVSTP